MVFRQADVNDAGAVAEIFSQAKLYFRSIGIDQWQYAYPCIDDVLDDVGANVCRVAEDCGEVCAAVSAILGIEPTYVEIDGQWSGDAPYIAIHRLAVRADRKGEGIGALVLNDAEETGRRLGALSARIDTHYGNTSMRRLLDKNGYRYCGTILLEDGSPRAAYDKVL